MDMNHSTVLGSQWKKNRLSPLSSASIATISSVEGVKSNRSKFCCIRFLCTDFGMMTTPLCSRKLPVL